MATSTKKNIKIRILGLIILESENWTFREFLIIMITSMIFVLLVIVILKLYAIPAWGVSLSIKKSGMILSKLRDSNIFRPRSP